MKQTNWLHNGLRLIVIIQFMLSLVFPAGALAASAAQGQPQAAAPAELSAVTGQALPSALLAEEPQAETEETTLSVAILSSPYVMYDSNGKAGKPSVFVVEGKVTNTSLTVTATDVSLKLTFDNPANPGWKLLSETSPSTRQFTDLAPGESFYGYWFAEYPASSGLSHTYSIEADATNAAPVSTSTNTHGDPLPGKTVATQSAIDTGNNGITQVTSNVIVGVSFDVNIEYSLGNNATVYHFSPVGNTNFNASAYRLLSANIDLLNGARQLLKTVPNTVYVKPTDYTGLTPVYAVARFNFIAVKLASTNICPYAVIKYTATTKYDNGYCDPAAGTSIPIDATVSMELKKVANKTDLQQNETIDYTIYYTNTGSTALSYVWIWDVYNSDILTTTATTPAPDLADTRDGLVAWFIGPVGAAGQPGDKGTLTITAKADGSYANKTIYDIADQTANLNTAYFGIDQGGLPKEYALMRPHTSTIHAPNLTIGKTDNKTAVTAGDPGTYEITLTNTGSVNAIDVSLVDTLPTHVSPGPGAPFPSGSVVGNTVTWSGFNIAPNIPSPFLLPVTYSIRTPDQTTVTNSAQVTWKNAFGHTFVAKTAQDSTLVNNAVLTITKTGPAKVLIGRDMTYQLNYTNTGHGPATNVVITDLVPAETTYVSCTPAPCGESSGTVTWTLDAPVPAGGTDSVSFTVKADGTNLVTGSTITNSTYTINSDQYGPVNGAPTVNTIAEKNAALFNVRTYADLNCNNQFDLGTDLLLSGVEITLSYGSVVEKQSTVDGVIPNPFRVEESVNVTISAPNVTNYYRSSPESLTFPAVLGTTKDIDFQYISTTGTCAVLYGIVFDDVNHNGTFDPGELGLPGVEVYSVPAADSGGVLTNSDGIYRLSYHLPTNVTVYEVNPAGYVSTTPDSYPVSIAVPSNNFSPYDFGDFAGIKVSGKVFNDANASGADDTEAGLAGAKVSLGLDSMTTDTDGLFTLFAAVTPGQPLTLSEVNPAGYVSTNSIPGSAAVTKVDFDTMTLAAPVAGTVYDDNKFGDALKAGVVTVTGFAWDDNGAGGGGLANGQKDGTEPGLAGVTVGLDSGMEVTTGSLGEFTLYGPASQALSLYSVNKAGYTSTNAIPGSMLDSKVDNDTITLASRAANTTVADNLYGDVLTGSVAVISGKTFDDTNQNGILDGLETGIAGVLVTLVKAGQPDIVVTTSAAGDYELAVTPGVDVMISTSLPAGYYRTTPSPLFFNVPAAGNYPGVNFGFSNDTDQDSVIYGWVFDDKNSNGQPDLGEPGLGGAQIDITGFAPIITTGSGLLAGTFSVKVPLPAVATIYNVKETNPALYRSTTPDTLNVKVSAVPTSYFVEFGDTNSSSTGTIYGIVYDDLNGDGVQDVDEVGLPGVVISTTVGTGVITTTTKTYGQFSYGFELAEQGYHTVQSEDPAKPGYRSTTPDQVNIYVELGNSYVVDFGDTMAGYANIMGTVFDDLNIDGHQDPGEPGIPGVTVTLAPGIFQVTDQFGTYTFPVDTNGLYTVTETDPPAPYYSTTDNAVKVNVTAAGNYFVNFGDTSDSGLIAFYGTVYNDANVNGKRDATELGLAGVPVELTLEGALNPPYAAVTTNEWGQYTFMIDVPGTWFIDAGPMLNYMAINANPGSMAVTRVDANTLSAVVAAPDFGKSLGDNLFGFAMSSGVVTISGQVFDDNGLGGGVIGDGKKNGSEPGLAGALIELSTGMSMMTLSDGLFSLFAPAGVAVTIAETNPGDTISTGAVAGNNAAVVDPDHITVASNLPVYGTSSGNLFGDLSPTDYAFFTGYVFDDTNADGVMNGVEAGLAGVEVTMKVKDGATVVTTTNPDGKYQFALAVGSTALITSSGPADAAYYPTTSETVSVSATAAGVFAGNDFGYSKNTSAYALYGVVFNDADGNGIQGLGEGGLGGVKITLSTGAFKNTGPDGRYTFVLDAPTGPATLLVTETDPAGYHSTTPNLVPVPVTVAVHSYSADFGDKLDNGQWSSIYGMVFNDANANGAWDASETGIAGVKVTLTGGTAPVEYTTNQWGQFTFLVEATGTYLVNETDPGTHVSTNAIPGSTAVTKVNNNTLSVAVTTLGTDFGNNLFGDVLRSSVVEVSGMVWEDANGNRAKDALETGLAGAKVSLSSGMFQMTGTDGLYLLYAPANTVVQLSEINPTNYISTNAIPGTGNTKVNNDRITVSSRAGGSTTTDNFFGDAHLADSGVIYGYVYEDANGNFTFDNDESAIAGVTVNLTGPSSLSIVTDSEGYYQFVVPTAGIYTVTETDLAGYFSTTPNKLSFAVAIGSSYEVNFGDASKNSGFGVIYGVVYEDKNTDTIRDTNEVGLADVTVTLDDLPVSAVTTSEFGAYGFKVTAGTHKVRETDPGLYQSSTPNLVFKTVANGESLSVDFGDFLPSVVCTGVTTDDLEPNDTAEAAFEVTDFTKAYDLNFFDDPTDWIKFTAQARATYTITVDASFGNRTDSLITMYASDKTTVLAVNDDVVDKTDFSSRLVFTAPNVDTVYYLKISNRSELKGCFTEYQLKFEEKPSPLKFLFLPLIMKEPVPAEDAGPSGLQLPAAPMVAQDISGITSVESPDGLINHICQDDSEIDDTWEEARSMTLASGMNTQVHSFDSNTALYAADKDHIKFNFRLLDTVSFTVIPVDNTQAVIELYDSERNLLKKFEGYSFNWSVLADGEYYLIVSPAEENTAFGCADVAGYTLKVDYNPVKFLFLPLITR